MQRRRRVARLTILVGVLAVGATYAWRIFDRRSAEGEIRLSNSTAKRRRKRHS
jgi:hypothetical protein